MIENGVNTAQNKKKRDETLGQLRAVEAHLKTKDPIYYKTRRGSTDDFIVRHSLITSSGEKAVVTRSNLPAPFFRN